MEQSCLTFGDLEFKNDLNSVRNDNSPFLLTRNNILHRSFSSPCLSPTGKNKIHQPRNRSRPIEILGKSDSFDVLKPVAKDIIKAMKLGIDPLPVNGGLGGAYYFKNPRGQNVALVKPTDEEPYAPNNPKGFVGKSLGQPGLKRSVRIGETGYREVVAYLLDYENFAKVPPTALVKITNSVFNVNNYKKKHLVTKIASFQKYIHHDFDASDHGTSSFPVSAVHRIGILDIRILNTDRHAGNILVKKLDGSGRFDQVELVPIDHGLCLPEALEDPYFEWIHWPQSSIPFSEDELEYIKKLDPIKDSMMLKRELPMIREACLRVLVVCTIFLKTAAGFGFCLAEIGEMMSREFRAGEEDPSELEVICLKARELIAKMKLTSPKSPMGDYAEFQFDIDSKESDSQFGNGFLNSHFPVSELEEYFEEKDFDIPASISSLSSMSLIKDTKFSEPKQENSYSTSSSEQLPASVIFVKLADMNEEEWAFFLDKFQELLCLAFEKRKSLTLGQKQRQRLGTSCQF
ncbi:hypothetical protein CCACVL1_05141 [Corchorus capsularis]|uniref:1-phosphatidylinositol 4-kinase n=1 Tax=Corchorus capsularis TaxID=210143 RepID=A0A1R3JM96_COCAP|nr:hypothetical protein CCACVL1_05141 [Corchorus capsularis]